MKMKNNILFSLIFMQGLSLSGCGKYQPPLPPEYFSPEEINNLKVTAEELGVKMSWKAPDSDQRGESLKQIDGYRIYRKELHKQSDILSNDEVEFELLRFVNDNHLIELDKQKERLRQQGKPARRASVSDELKSFEYLDQGAEKKKSYLYKILPVNQGGVEGSVVDLYEVDFDGVTSEITKHDFDKKLVEKEEP